MLTFPNPVNDYAARSTAGLVVLLAVVAIVVDNPLVYAVLAIGFALRVASGPTLSPFGQLSVRVIVPHVIKKTKLVPGPPKRFAQTIGLLVSGTALVLSLLGYGLAAQITTGVLIVAALLESVLGFCLGCAVFGFLQRRGVIPDSVCEACNNISLRDSDPGISEPAARGSVVSE
ncbi:uncharacterized protein DUF4395 [Williamsia limnetica]|uniref:Uncharacterized protein DUF4395 n=1 Tax=Williamsia limnetica TaxID=882452 RepID=A0A318RYU0_WILLI|nr:DUF4395 domain-containing protein [Williamsia limnetica]PYE19125.1 uncharacterized protein DUF4395 [Williamsia limnetica]